MSDKKENTQRITGNRGPQGGAKRPSGRIHAIEKKPPYKGGH
jgi:hypothetical protein